MTNNNGGHKSKYWCFTLNNPSDVEEAEIKNLVGVEDQSDFTYLIFGRETSSTGTPHFQGYFELKRRLRLRTIKARHLCLSRVHLEPRRGSAIQADEYCRKDGNYEVFGTISRSNRGRRSDLEQIRDKIESGSGDLEIAREHFSKWCIYRRSFDRFRNMVKRPAAIRELRVTVLYGVSGSGKTYFVHDYAASKGDRLYTHGGDRWFDGYDGHSIVMFDDFDGSQIEFRMLLRVLDKYPMRVPVKGGFVDWEPLEIFITTNVHPTRWYQSAITGQHGETALLRRIHEIREFNDVYLEF